MSRSRRKVLEGAIRRLERAGIESARRNVEWMLCEVLHCTRADLYAKFDEPLPTSQMSALGKMLSRREAHEPLQYILGYAEFFGLRIRVTPDVLIPRPETEQVVESALQEIRSHAAPRVLDVGTGSGCIALAIKNTRPDAFVVGCDVSPAAIAIAEENATSLGLDVSFVQLDALSPDFGAQAPAELDLVVSNPPYVSEAEAEDLPDEVSRYEPHIALFAPDDPLIFYEKISADARRLLRPGGRLVFETHAEFGSSAVGVVREAGFDDVELRRDYAGHPRILIAQRP